MWAGLQMSKGLFWVLLNISLSLFTISGIGWAIWDGEGKMPRAIPVIFILALIILIVLIFIQAPYRGLLKELEQVQDKVEKQTGFTNMYEQQRNNWKSNIRLSIKKVLVIINGDVPSVKFDLEVVNMLPVEIKFLKVIHSQLYVTASGDSCNLPSLRNETIDKRVYRWSENQFELKIDIGGTNAVSFLESKIKEPGQFLQWTLKGEWYVEIYEKEELWETKSYNLIYNQVIVKQKQ